MQNNKITINKLNFGYKSNTLLFNNFSIEVPDNSIFCLAGPNGAGKTTLLKLISERLTPNSGEITIGTDKSANKLTDLYFFQDTPQFYRDMTARTNLEILCDYTNKDYSKIDDVLQRVKLDEPKKKVKEYSLGMKKRLSLAVVLLFDSKIILMDEPFNSLDPGGIKFIREFVEEEHNNKGKTFIISSHLLREVGSFCTHYGIINKGKMIVSGENTGDIDLIEDMYFSNIEGSN